MVKTITIPVLAIAALVLLMLALQTKSIDCVVSADNPYSAMPMVCKSVLKVPQE